MHFLSALSPLLGYGYLHVMECSGVPEGDKVQFTAFRTHLLLHLLQSKTKSTGFSVTAFYCVYRFVGVYRCILAGETEHGGERYY